MCLFILFVLAIELSEIDRLNVAEVFFMIYALGFTLEKIAAMQEHGIRGNPSIFYSIFLISYTFPPQKVYFKGTWVRGLILCEYLTKFDPGRRMDLI